MAKFYVAKKYVKISENYVAIPGEVIELDMPEKEIDRLLRKGAIKKAEDIIGIPYPEDDASIDGEPYAEDGSIAEDKSTEPDPDEIDVMDGISQPKGKTARKSKK